MKYKVGERVRIVSKASGILSWTDEVDVYPGKVMTISGIKTTIITGGYYIMKEDNGYWPWYENSIAGLASEVPFDFKVWEGKKVCMHCKTEEESEDFCREIDKACLRWCSGDSYLKMKCFNTYKDLTCYCFNKGTYDSTVSAKDKGYTILEWSKYRSTEPPKDEEQEKIMSKSDNKPLSFQETMDIYKRLCEHHRKRNSCRECPVGSFKNYTGKMCRDFLIENTDKAEPILKEWIAEHPFKTNEQKCNEMFLEVFGMQYATALMHPNWWLQEYVEPYKEEE